MPRVAVLCAVFLVAVPMFGGSYVVTNTNDNGAGSFRQGILDANSAACTSPCTITFDSTLFATTQTIFLNTPAMTVTASDVLIDGFSGGTVGSPNTNAFGSADNSVHRVVINGASNTCCPITVSGNNFKIRGVVLQDFLTALVIQGTNAAIAGCKIGTDAAGLAAGSPQNVTGIQVTSSGSASIGGTAPADRNLISGNLGTGIDLQSDGNAVLGNYIGINATGTAAIANSTGIAIASNNNIIGGTSLGNVISGNSSRGVSITAGSGNNVESNRIGTNAAGSAAVANGTGVFIGSGSLPGAVDVGSTGFGNLISGNTNAGIEINNSSGSNGIVDNNIGLNLAGSAAIPNGSGIVLLSAGTNNTIEDNVLAGNTGNGIAITSTASLLIQNNEIGDFGGTPFGNGGHGIVAFFGTSSTTIFNNIIKNNGQSGVDVDGAIIGIGIKQNEIGENTGIGIDLHASATDLGATANDTGDSDSGTGNHSQNFPAVASAYLNGTTGSATLTVQFSVDSSSVPTTAGLRVEAFEADTDVTNPEGIRFLGFQCFGGNTLSNSTMAITAAGLVPGDKIVMTATSYTDASCTTINEGTSEFSPGAVVAVQPGLVVNTNDSGTGSLRQAITDANGGACAFPCTITFAIPNTDPNFASGVYTIRPLSALPAIERSNTILDGTTQTTFGGDTNALGPEIEINGSLAPATTTGLAIGGSTALHGANIQIKNVVVNGFDGYGINVAGLVPITSPKILGCYVGTNATGSAAVANSLDGIFAGNNVTNMQIGAAFNGNIISGNGGNGIQLMGTGVADTIILGNGIGTDQSKTTGIPNSGDGIFGDMTSMHVGGQLVGEANVIAFNALDGITLISSATQNELRYNSIHSNGDLGIDFSNNGPDTNDALDADGDPNGGQNFPVLTLAVYNSGTNQTTVSGTLHSLPSTTFDIDWYTNTTADPSGFGEGETYEGTSTWSTDGSGNANVSIVLNGNKRFQNITATATRIAGLVKETSEFSAVVLNNAPTANADAPSTNEDVPLTFDPRANDTDPEGDTLSITANTQPAPSAGSVTCSAIDCTFTPVAEYSGPATFSYTISDGNGGTANGSVTITVNVVDDPPVANADTLSTSEETPNTVNVLTNDTDVDTAPASLTVTAFTNGTKGNVNCTAAGACTYSPNTDQTGPDSFTYTVSDGTTPVTGTVNVTITAVDDPPVANADTLTTAEDTPNSVNVLTNDTDVDTAPAGLSVTGSTNGTKGNVGCTTAGVCTYTPNADQTGADSFTYTVFDGTSSVTGTVNVTINAVDDPPVANTDTLTTSEETPNTVNVLTNDTDVDTAPASLTVTAFTNGTKGTVNCTAAGACTYSPNTDQTGADSFTYTVSDGTTPVTGTVNVTITAVDDPPVANADTLTTAEDTPNSVNVLTNDTDVDTAPAGLSVTGSTNGTKGSVGCTTAGVCTYTPNADQTGPDSFTYTVFDGTSSVTGTVNVTINAVDDPPVANTDTLTTSEETPNTVNVLTNDTDVDTAPASLTVTGFTNGAKGTVNCTTAGACTYSPNVDQTGSDSFTYTVSDGTSSVTGTVNVTINAVDDPPVANTDTLNTSEETPNSVNVLTNDTDVDTAPAGLSVIGSTNGAKGSVNCSTSGLCTYTPAANQTGADTFTYTVTDGTTPVTGTVNVNIGATNDPPAANPDTLTTVEDTPNSVNVIANDTDPDFDPLTVTSNTQGSKGSVSCTVAGVCTYTPNTNQTGADSFKYVVSDGTAFATGTVSVTITPANDPPVALDDSASTEQGVAVTINVVANDTDPDSDPLTVASFTQGANGTVTCSASECTYTPNAGFTGTDSFTYVVKDPSLASDTGSVSITVLACPAAPGSLTPSHGSTNVPTSGLLQWDETGAASYKVFLGRSDQDGCSTFAGFAFDNEFAYSNLLPGTSYTWRVESIAGSCTPQTSDCMTFRTAPMCDGSITLIQPIGGTHGSPIEFRWTAVANASEYQVFVFGEDNTGLLFPIGTTTGTSLVVNVPGNGPMTWYVVATVPNCGTVQSPPESFTLCNRPATPEARVVGQVTSSQKYKVEWDAVANAVRYEVDQADNLQFTNPTTISTEQTFVQFEHEVNAPRALYYRVRAFGSCTPTPSANSTTIRVVVVPLPPRDTPGHETNVPAGSEEVVVMEVFIPGEPGQTLFFTATTDRPWLAVTPPNGTLPPEGVTLQVTADPKTLPNGTFTASVIVTVTSPSNLTTNGTGTITTPISISLVTPVSPVASKTAPDPNTLIIPAVGHLDGINSHWQSDIRVTNVGFSSAKYDLTFVPAGGTSSGVRKTTITVDAGATTALDDILKNWFGVGSLGDGANGMLEIRAADGKPMSAVASSRTYNVTADGTLGQFIPALKFGSFIGKALPNAAKSVLSLQQVAQSQLYRTNVGVAEASGNAANVLLSVFNVAGSKLLDIPVSLKAGEQQQLNGILAQHGISADDARIEVTVPSGDGKVTAYASVVDNTTHDPLLVHGTPLDGVTSAKYVLPGVADLTNASANWRTDMRIFNAGLASQTATLTLFGGGAPLSAEVTLQPGEVRTLDDVVRALFLAQNVGGAVHITTSSPGTLVVTGRTYNQTGNGTYGQFIPAVTPDEAVGAGGGTLHVLQVEDSTRYRTNLGIAEVTGKPVTVEVQVVLPDSKVTPTVTFSMSANEFRQFGIIREMGLGNVYNGRIAVRVIGGEGRVTAYGSVIDQITQDPTYVPAQR